MRKPKLNKVILILMVAVFALAVCFACNSNAKVTSLEVKSFPPTLLLGQQLPKDAAVTVSYDDGTTKDVTLGDTSVSGYSSATPGKQRVTIAYEGVSVVVEVEVLTTRTVQYVAEDGGDISGTTTQTVVDGTGATTVKAIPWEGYRFSGWSDGITTASRQDSSITADVTYTAVFTAITYLMKFYSYDESNNTFSLKRTDDVGFGAEYVVPTLSQKAITGYTFVGYASSDKKGGVKGDTTLSFTPVLEGAELSPTASASFYPIYVPVSYTATYTDDVTGNVLLTLTDLPYGESFDAYSRCASLISAVDIVLSLYDYGWTINDQPLTSANGRFILLSDVNVHLTYSPKPVAVSYYSEGQRLFTTAGTEYEKAYLDSFNVYALAAQLNDGKEYALTGYKDLCWNLGETRFDADDEYTVSSINEVRFTLSKTPVTFTVAFGDSIDEQTIYSATAINYGDDLTKPASPESAQGLIFDNWYADVACTQIFDFSEKHFEDTKAFAGWLVPVTLMFTNASVSYTYKDLGTAATVRNSLQCYVRYNSSLLASDGSSGFGFYLPYTNSSTNVTSMQYVVTDGYKPVRANYEFVGWFTNDAYTASFAYDSLIISAVTLYAFTDVSRITLNVALDCGTVYIGCSNSAHESTPVLISENNNTGAKIYFRQCSACTQVSLSYDDNQTPQIKVAKVNSTGQNVSVKATYYEPIGYENTAFYLGSVSTPEVTTPLSLASSQENVDGIVRNVYTSTFIMSSTGYNATTGQSYFAVLSTRKMLILNVTNRQNTYDILVNGRSIKYSDYVTENGSHVSASIAYGDNVIVRLTPNAGYEITNIVKGPQTINVFDGEEVYDLVMNNFIVATSIAVSTAISTYDIVNQGSDGGTITMFVVGENGTSLTDTEDDTVTGVAYGAKKGYTFAVDDMSGLEQVIAISINGEYIFRGGVINTVCDTYVNYVALLDFAENFKSGRMIIKNINDDMTISIIFAVPNITLAVNVTNGTVAALSVGETQFADAVGATQYSVEEIPYASELLLDLLPAVGFEIQSISFNGEVVEQLPEIITEASVINVVCTELTFDVVLTKHGNGTVSVKKGSTPVALPYTYKYGEADNLSFSAVADTQRGYIIKSITINGVAQTLTGDKTGFNYTSPAYNSLADYTDYAIDVEFALRTQTITIKVNNASGIPMGSVAFDGTAFSAALSASATYTFDKTYGTSGVLANRLAVGLYVSAFKVTLKDQNGTATVNTNFNDATNAADKASIAAIFTSSYQLINIQTNVEIEITVKLDSYNFVCEQPENGTVVVTDRAGTAIDLSKVYVYGTIFRLKVTPAQYYSIQYLRLVPISGTGEAMAITDLTSVKDADENVLYYTSGDLSLAYNTQVESAMEFTSYAVTVTNNLVNSEPVSTISGITVDGKSSQSMPRTIQATGQLQFNVVMMAAYSGRYALSVYVNDVDCTETVLSSGTITLTIKQNTDIVLSYTRIEVQVSIKIEGIVSGDSMGRIDANGKKYGENGEYIYDEGLGITDGVLVNALDTLSLTVTSGFNAKITVSIKNKQGTVLDTKQYTKVSSTKIVDSAALVELEQDLIITVTYEY